MNKRIEYLYESPCYQCGKQYQCSEKVKRCPCLQDIVDYVMPRADYDYKKCMMYRVLKVEEKHGK